MKTLVVVNPKSANADTGRRWGELSALLAKHVGEVRVEFTKAPMDAVRLAREGLQAGFDCIAACGGDGTINEVVNGFFESDRIINSQAALAVLPRGTGGDFRKTFGWETSFVDAARRLASGRTRRLDLGRVEFVDHQGCLAVRYFANICSFGSSGLVDAEVNAASKFLGGRLSFALAGAKAMARYRDQLVQVSFDGGPNESLSVTTLAVCNGQFFGGGMKVSPTADPHDGAFDVTVWSGYALKDFILKSAGLYSGDHVKWKGTRTLRCRELVATSKERVLIDCDGEQPGFLDCRITMVPGAIELVGAVAGG
jgi:YegS/Rv2252/BmrU family lipid kinase